MIFLKQFKKNALVNFFKDCKLHLPYQLMQFWSSLKKITCAYLFQIALENTNLTDAEKIRLISDLVESLLASLKYIIILYFF